MLKAVAIGSTSSGNTTGPDSNIASTASAIRTASTNKVPVV